MTNLLRRDAHLCLYICLGQETHRDAKAKTEMWKDEGKNKCREDEYIWREKQLRGEDDEKAQK